MKYVKVAQINELPAGNKKKIILENKTILLTNIQGNYYAMDNTCPHMGGSLYDGSLNGNNIACPKHGSVFDVRTGKVVHKGKILFVKVKVNDVAIYPVKIEDTDILIGIE